MAEGIARDRYPELATYASAGTMAIRRSAPTGPAMDVTHEIGIDISSLRGASLSETLDPVPDIIYVMTEHHLIRVTSNHPELADRVELLDPDGEIADPYGSDTGVYRAARRQIETAIESRAVDWAEQAS